MQLSFEVLFYTRHRICIVIIFVHLRGVKINKKCYFLKNIFQNFFVKKNVFTQNVIDDYLKPISAQVCHFISVLKLIIVW